MSSCFARCFIIRFDIQSSNHGRFFAVFVGVAFRFAFGRYEVEEDDCSLDVLRQSFADSGYDVRELLIGIVTSDSFRYRAVAP